MSLRIEKYDNLELRYCETGLNEEGLDEIVTDNFHLEDVGEGTVCITFENSEAIINIFAIKKGKLGINIT